MRWFSGRPSSENGWPVTLVSSEEINAKFAGGQTLFFYNMKQRFKSLAEGFEKIFSALT